MYLYYLLKLIICSCAVIIGLVDAYAPCLTLRVRSFCHYFASYLHHEIPDTHIAEKIGYMIHAESFGNGTEVNNHPGVFLVELTILYGYTLPAYKSA